MAPTWGSAFRLQTNSLLEKRTFCISVTVSRLRAAWQRNQSTSAPHQPLHLPQLQAGSSVWGRKSYTSAALLTGGGWSCSKTILVRQKP